MGESREEDERRQLCRFEAIVVDVTARLLKRFEGEVDPARIGTMVQQAASELAGARIALFVPVLVERHSVERLLAFDSTTSEASDENIPNPRPATWT